MGDSSSDSKTSVYFADFGHGAGASSLGMGLSGLELLAASDTRLDADFLYRSNMGREVASADSGALGNLVDVAVVSSSAADWRKVVQCRPAMIVSWVQPPHLAKSVFSFAKFSVNSCLFGSPLAKMQTVFLGIRGEGEAITSLLKTLVERVEKFSLQRKKVVRDLFPGISHFYLERDGSTKRVHSSNFPCPPLKRTSHRAPPTNFVTSAQDSAGLKDAHRFSMEELGLIAGFPPYYRWNAVDAASAMRLLAESVTVPVAYALGMVVGTAIRSGEVDRAVKSSQGLRSRQEKVDSEEREVQEAIRLERRRRTTPRLSMLASLGAMVERFSVGRRQATYVFGTSPSLDHIVSGFMPGVKLLPGWVVLVRERSGGQGEDTFWRESALSTKLLRTREQVSRAVALQRFNQSPAGRCFP